MPLAEDAEGVPAGRVQLRVLAVQGSSPRPRDVGRVQAADSLVHGFFDFFGGCLPAPENERT